MNSRFNAEEIHSLEQKIGYLFKDKQLLEKALTLTSPNKDAITHAHLEFLGASVLSLIVANRAFEKLTHLKEGALRRLRAKLLKDSACSLYFDNLSLMRHVKAVEKLKESNKLSSAIMHALIGAIFKDGGLEPASLFFNKKCLPSAKSIIQDRHHFNWRRKLHDLCLRKHKKNPSYVLLSEEGPEHEKVYQIGVFMNDNLLAKASARTKKQAASEAASKALRRL